MKQFALLLICVLSIGGAFAQNANDALNHDNQTLRERYLVMKTKSQNYQEYKVIKENLLDSWLKLQNELNESKEALAAKEASMKDVEHASSHITVLGIDFSKGFFAGLVGVIILGLGLTIAVILYMLKALGNNLKEKADLANAISSEYEEYKRKAMEKQTKLSRELQNERNKLMELGAL
jgi:hypothetical protein